MKRNFLFGCLLFAAGCALPGGAGALDAALRELVACPDLAGGRVGVAVVDAASGRPLLEHAADRGFLTASNMKLVSAAVSLVTLGADYAMATELVMRGELRDSVLDGSLVLRGHGDPGFGDLEPGARAVAGLVDAVRSLGIRRVRGGVFGDGSWLGAETLGLGWQWDYLDDDYAAPFGGLCFAGNVMTVVVAPGAAGPSVRVLPLAEAVPAVALEQGDAGGPTKVEVRRAPIGGELVIRGTLAADAREQRLRVPVRDPAAFAAAGLAAALRAAGVTIDGQAAPMAQERVIAAVASPPLAAVLQPMLRDSNNLHAEQVWRVAARVATGDGSTASAERHAKAVLASLGVEPRGMVLADGSGLSRRNLVQPRQLAALLAAMHRSPHRDAFVAGLPIAGRTGTLAKRFTDGPASGRVRAKTGYIARVVCLSGYLPRPGGEAPLVFSVMLNDFTCDDAAAKAAVDTFVQRLAAAVGW